MRSEKKGYVVNTTSLNNLYSYLLTDICHFSPLPASWQVSPFTFPIFPVLCNESKPHFLNKRLKIFLNYFLGPVLFIWLCYSIYRQVQTQENLQQSWDMILASATGPQSWKFLLAIMLLGANFGAEAFKWKILISAVQKVSFWKAMKATLSGHALVFNSINRLGESAARSLYLDEGHRLKGMAISMVGSLSLIIVNFVMGLLGMLYMRFFILDATHQLDGLSMFWLTGLMSVLCFGTVLLILLYYKLSWLIRLLEKIPLVARYSFVLESMEKLEWRFLTKILLLSMLRYVVFIVQYVLMMQVFEVGVSVVDTAALVAVMLLVLSIVPSITLAELGIRGEVSLLLFGLLSNNLLGIIATTGSIWIINLIIPAIAGSIFLLGIRLFRNNK